MREIFAVHIYSTWEENSEFKFTMPNFSGTITSAAKVFLEHSKIAMNKCKLYQLNLNLPSVACSVIVELSKVKSWSLVLHGTKTYGFVPFF